MFMVAQAWRSRVEAFEFRFGTKPIPNERTCAASWVMNFFGELKHGVRSLVRAKGLTVTVVLTLALGIGANAAIFALVRGVLLRALANRDEDRLIYIRQSARGIGVENTHFSVPQIQDLRARVKTSRPVPDHIARIFRVSRRPDRRRTRFQRC